MARLGSTRRALAQLVVMKVITYFYQAISGQSSARFILEVITDFHCRRSAPCTECLVGLVWRLPFCHVFGADVSAAGVRCDGA